MSAKLSTGPAGSDRSVWPSEDGCVSGLLFSLIDNYTERENRGDSVRQWEEKREKEIVNVYVKEDDRWRQ